jgi:endonuclease/exonuclease/phosphatase family metal-dependent hydrolase
MKILTWNISFGYGLGSEGSSATHPYQPKDRPHYESALRSIAGFIQTIDPDIALLQEVDFGSHRSHNQNQLEVLAGSTGLAHHRSIVSWHVPYLPYPGLNPRHHFGKTVSGGAILSKKPIRVIQDDLLPQPREFNPLYKMLYLHRYLQIVETFDLNVCNLHLEAFSNDNRELHLSELQERLVDHDIDVAGGDFNGEFSLKRASEERWMSCPCSRATFPSDQPTRKLDGFIVKKGRFSTIRVETLNSGIVSDHFPSAVILT